MRREDYVSKAFFNQCVHHSIVARSLRQPHRLSFTSETKPKIGEAPTNLGPQIAFIAQWQNRVAVRLRDRVAVTVVFHRALPIGVENSVVGFRMLLLKPTQERRPKIETDVLVVIDRARLARRRIRNCRRRVWLITLGVNSLIPVMKRRRAGLFFDDSRPRVFARRLIEMSVDN